MNCLEFQGQCFINPDNNDDAFIEHLNNCDACADFYAQIKYADRDLASAIKINEPENLKSSIMLRQSMLNDKKRNWTTYYALTASLLMATIITLMFTWHSQDSSLEDVVVAYVEGVHKDYNNSANLNHAVVIDVLRPLGMTLSSDFGPVQAAMPCLIRGKNAAHLVVPGKFGSIDIVYMPAENIDNRLEMKHKGSKLVLVPCPKGSLAIVGSGNEHLAEVETRIQAASDWM